MYGLTAPSPETRQQMMIAPSDLSVTELRGEAAFYKLRSDWDELWLSSTDATDTQTWCWQYLYWKHLAPHTEPILVCARNGDGVCVALAAFYICRDQASGMKKAAFLGDKRPDYHLILARPNLPMSVGQSLLDHFISCSQKKSVLIELTNVPKVSYTGLLLEKLASDDDGPAGLKLRWETETYGVSLPRTIEDYKQLLGSKTRRDFGYDRRRLAKEFNVEFRAYDSSELLEDALDAIESIDKGRWGENSRYYVNSHRLFERSVAKSLTEAGLYRALILYLDGKPSAFVTGAVVRNALKVAAIGYDRSLPANLSVGKVTNFYAIEHCIEKGYVEYDLTRGGETYKKWLGGQPSVNLHLRIYRGGWARSMDSAGQKMMSLMREQQWMRRLYRSLIRK